MHHNRWTWYQNHDQFAVTEGASLDIENQNGSITIVPANGDSIVFHTVKRTIYGKSEFDKTRIQLTKDDPFTIVTKVLREPTRVSVDYELRVPRSMLARTAETTNGSIEVTGVSGLMELHTSNGSVKAETMDGAVRTVTTNGSITLRKVTAVAGVTTSNGSIECEVAALDGTCIDIHTTNDNLDFAGITLDNATASKHSIRGDPGTRKGALSVRTTNGTLTVQRLNP